MTKKIGNEPNNPYRAIAGQKQSRRGGSHLQDALQQRLEKMADDYDAQQPAEPEPENPDPVHHWEVPPHAQQKFIESVNANHPKEIQDVRRSLFAKSIAGDFGPAQVADYLAASRGLDSAAPQDAAAGAGEEQT